MNRQMEAWMDAWTSARLLLRRQSGGKEDGWLPVTLYICCWSMSGETPANTFRAKGLTLMLPHVSIPRRSILPGSVPQKNMLQLLIIYAPTVT